MKDQIVFKLEGDRADDHRLPAYSGVESFQGLTQSSVMILNFLATGNVRRRRLSDLPIDIEINSIRPGSLEFVIDFALREKAIEVAKWVGLAAAGGTIGNLCTDLMKGAYRRVIGGDQPETIDALEANPDFPAGKFEDLVQAIEPATRRGHQVINHGSQNIVINVSGDNNVVNFTPETKDYLWESVINNELRVKLFSIGGYDSNSRIGKAYDFEEGRNISFELIKEADQVSVETILSSHRQYALRSFHGVNDIGAIALAFTSVHAVDGRTKKIRVRQARQEIADIGR